MTYLAILAPLVLATFVVWMALTVIRFRERASERREQAWLSERKELLDRIMYLSEKPWKGPEIVEAPERPVSLPEITDPLLEVI